MAIRVSYDNNGSIDMVMFGSGNLPPVMYTVSINSIVIGDIILHDDGTASINSNNYTYTYNPTTKEYTFEAS